MGGNAAELTLAVLLFSFDPSFGLFCIQVVLSLKCFAAFLKITLDM
jgi:hypothetical protein